MQDALILSLDNINDAQVVDLGASFHATPYRKYFQDYVQGDFGYVYLGDDKAYNIVGKGKVLVMLQNKDQWMLNHVRHILDLRRNLISSEQLHHMKIIEGQKGIFGISKGR